MKPTSNRLALIRGFIFAAGYIFLFASSLFYPAEDLLAEDRPVIQVNFEFVGVNENDLSKEDRAAIKLKAENLVCEVAEKSWGFLDWSNESQGNASTAKWNISFKVEFSELANEPHDPIPVTKVTLRHTGLVAGLENEFHQIEENYTIYKPGYLIPFDDPVTLGGDITKKLDEQLSVLFKKEEVKSYIKDIPIVERIIAEKGIKRYLIPLQRSDLRTKENSILKVQFKISDHESGLLYLDMHRTVSEEGQYTGYVKSRVKDLDIHPMNIETDPPLYWDDDLSTMIDSATEIKVYMEEYKAGLASVPVVDGIATEPDAGGEPR